MGFLDKVKAMFGTATDAAAEHKDTVKDGVDKAADFAKDKVGDQHEDKIDKGAEAAKDYVDGLGDDD